MGREGRREERQKTRVSGEGGEERLHETESWKREREREREREGPARAIVRLREKKLPASIL